jgi:hypothetical protein
MQTKRKRDRTGFGQIFTRQEHETDALRLHPALEKNLGKPAFG